MGDERSRLVRGLKWGVFSLTALSILVTGYSDEADARHRKRGYHHSAKYKAKYNKYKKTRIAKASRGYSPLYAHIVVDANTGQVLNESNPDSLRHPASLTKIMTLYLLFEQLEAGKLKLDSQMPISGHAASQSPTKLGLRSGQTLAVEDAIKGLVTRSANDAAVVIAETIGGSEDEFADQMTRKARALGMSRTVYRNASGLPNMEQVTTARDQ